MDLSSDYTSLFLFLLVDSTIMELDQDDNENKTKYDRIFQQFFGLILKRFHHSRRNIKGLLSQIFLPAIFVCIAMTVAMSRPGYEKQPRLILSPTMIRPLPNFIPFNNEGKSDISRRMEGSLRLPSGVGADCVLKHVNSSLTDIYKLQSIRSDVLKMYDSLCKKQLSEFMTPRPLKIENLVQKQSSSSKLMHENGNKKCRCSDDKRSYICDRGIEGHHEHIPTITGEQLINVTGRNMEKYLLYTTQHFQRHRY